MLGSEGEVFDAAFAEKPHPLIGVKAGGIEELVEDVVGVPKLPICTGEGPRCIAADHAVEAPMYADTEFAILEVVYCRLRRVMVAGIDFSRPSALHRLAVKRPIEAIKT